MTDRRLPRSKTVSVVVPAPPEAVWAVLTDVTRVGEWSHEATGARWVQGDGPTAGNAFKGTNRLRWIRWSRPCTVVESVPGVRFAWTTNGGLAGDATRWSFELEAVPEGTRITETYQIEKMPRLLEAAVVRLMPTHLDRAAAMAGDLARLGDLAAR
ncbi:uncharacterized protein YndB with AHSA1/START domain [Marmoricola sp. OAE513]|uniref:SRPBCC family protein n=1 Tax=Marmoricola sp. OAE513 TaxID=2817894 RepID=UPI001AE1E6AF